MTTTDEQASASQGSAEALHKITIAYGYGRPLDAVRAAMEDRAAAMLDKAQTPAQRAFAVAYDDTSQSLLADLAGDERAASVTLPGPGEPHPDRAGWQGCQDGCGVYVRADRPQPDRYSEIAVVPDREAG